MSDTTIRIVIDEDEAASVILAVMDEDTIPEMVCVTRQAVPWQLTMRDDGGSTELAEFDHSPTKAEIRRACREWAEGGEWGTEGACDEVDDGRVEVEIEPDHEALISAACGGKWDSRSERSCGTDPDDHDWTSEGEGGCAENPGVWSTGGTSFSFASHCRKCGLHRYERTTGGQKNPGDHDTVSYTMPESWCEDCDEWTR